MVKIKIKEIFLFQKNFQYFLLQERVLMEDYLKLLDQDVL